MIYVKDLIVNGSAEELQKAINALIDSELKENRYIQIISVLFVGNNSLMNRIYQIVYKYI